MIIPANPGFWLLEMDTGRRCLKSERVAVVAWNVDDDGQEASDPRRAPAPEDEPIILQPDGSIICGEMTYMSKNDFLFYMGWLDEEVSAEV